MQLTYPWFLLGLLAVAVPVIIHLLQLRRPQRVQFTNTGFIREIELITVRRRQLQHILVLVARVVGVAALVLMFCQPFIPAAEQRTTKAVQEVEVVVDNSPSMQAEGASAVTMLEQAVGTAAGVGRSYPAATRFRILNQSRAQLTGAAYQQQLEEMRAQGKPWVLPADDRAGGPLYIFSDYQKSTFSAKTLDNVAAGREVILVPQAAKPVGNIYVDSVWLEDAFVRIRANVELHVRLRNGGAATVAECPVKVYLGARQVAAFRVSVGAGQVATSVVQVQVPDDKLARGRVVTEDAPVTFDNTFYFTLRPAKLIKVVEIGPSPVAQALYGNEPLFGYTYFKPQNINFGVLRNASLVLVREVPQVNAGLRDALEQVSRRGGSVVVIPPAGAVGAAEVRRSYQQLFEKLGAGAAQWEAVSTQPELREVALPNAREPFFQGVFGARTRAVSMPRVAPVLRWSRTGRDIMRMQDGGSYLAEFSNGAGKTYVFAAPFASEYSDFTNHALFVPVLYRLAMLSYRDEQQLAYPLTQNTVNLTLPATAAAGQVADKASLRLVRDSLTLIPGQRQQGLDVRLEMPASLTEPGFYEVQRDGQALTTLAFNQDRRESELAAYSANELRELVGSDRPNVRVLDERPAGPTLAQLREGQTGQPLWRYFLALALLALLAETLLIRFGGQAVRPARAMAA